MISFNGYFCGTFVTSGLVFARIVRSQVVHKEGRNVKRNILFTIILRFLKGRSSPDNAENSISMANTVADNNRVSTIGLSSRLTSGKLQNVLF